MLITRVYCNIVPSASSAPHLISGKYVRGLSTRNYAEIIVNQGMSGVRSIKRFVSAAAVAINHIDKKKRIYNTRDSRMVTHRSTSLAI